MQSSAFSPSARPKAPSRWLAAGFGLLAAMACGMAQDGQASPAVTPSRAAECHELALGTNQLFLPRAFQPISNRVDLILHFHGHPPLMRDNLLKSGRAAALLLVNFRGLSAAYAKPFQGSELFDTLLEEARGRLASHFGRDIRFGRVALSSFSAGYGAVREILKRPTQAARITDLVLADSLYAGYAQESGGKVPDPAQLRDFARLAAEAAEGRKTLWVTYSQLVPGQYASTAETALELIKAAGAKRTPADGADETGMVRESVADRGRFHARSYQGASASDHMDHLRGIWVAWRGLGLAELPRP